MSEKIRIADSFIAKIGGLKWHLAARLWLFLWPLAGLFILKFIPLLVQITSIGRGGVLFILVFLWIIGGGYGWRFLHCIPKCPNCKKPISWLWADSEYDFRETNPSKTHKCPQCDWRP
jgi:hypothetical protein